MTASRHGAPGAEAATLNVPLIFEHARAVIRGS